MTGLIKDVNAPRNHNASLFVTALCACLGLLMAGTPAHARPSVAEAFRSENASVICSRFEASVAASFRVLKTEDCWLAPSAPRAENSSERISYQNTRPLVGGDRVLVVTRLARAGLPDSPATMPQAS